MKEQIKHTILKGTDRTKFYIYKYRLGINYIEWIGCFYNSKLEEIYNIPKGSYKRDYQLERIPIKLNICKLVI